MKEFDDPHIKGELEKVNVIRKALGFRDIPFNDEFMAMSKPAMDTCCLGVSSGANESNVDETQPSFSTMHNEIYLDLYS